MIVGGEGSWRRDVASSAGVRWWAEGDVACIELDDGHGNALGRAGLTALAAALRGVADADAVVLRGRSRIFCAGLDLRELAVLRGAALSSFLDLLHQTRRTLFTLPRPLVVAAAGSAIGAGASLLCCGDRRIGARDHGLVGFPEVQLAAPLMSSLRAIAGTVLTPAALHRALVLGEPLPRPPAVAAGFFYELVAPERLLETAMDAATRAATLPRAVAVTKASLRHDAVAQMDAARASSHEIFVRAWASAETQRRVATILQRLDRRSRSARTAAASDEGAERRIA